MPDVKRTVKIVTEQEIVPEKVAPVEGFPWRKWNVQVFMLNEHGDEIPATVFSKVTYILHETFEARQKQVFTQPPFMVKEEGWGEFEMFVKLSTIDKGGEFDLKHDLNFQSNRYEAKHNITFKNPKPALLAILRDSGPVPGDENGKKRNEDSVKKKKRMDKGVDMDKLAENLQRLQEDDLIHVVQMVHDGKTADSYTKNDVDAGEFHVDLYTLPDSLIKQLWDYSEQKVNER